MSLIVWMPLNGDLINNGVGNVTISGSGTFTAEGKIGKCLSGGSTIDITSQTLTNSKTWSVCFWGYVVSANVTDNWTKMIRMADGGNNLRIEVCPKSYDNGIFCYSTHNNATYKITTDSLVAPSGGFYDQWHHFCMTSDGITICVYDNGTLRGTMSYNGSGAITGTFTLNNNSIIKKNDFRIYDTCLSPREVSELSKALVLHYPMTGGGRGGDNILTNSTGLQGTTDWSGAVSTATENGCTYLIAQRTNTTSTSRTSCAHSAITSLVNNWTPGSKFTLSGYYRVPSSETYDVTANMFIRWRYSGSSGSYSDTGFSTPSSVTKDTWIRFENTYTVPANYVDGTVDFYLSAFSQGLSTVHWKNIKLELSDHATPWMPNSADTAYTTMGYNDNIEYDVSGYNYHGTKIGTIAYSSDTPRYNTSTVFNGTDTTINCGRAFHVQGAKNMSMSCWAYCEDWTADTNPKYLLSSQQSGGLGLAYLNGTTMRAVWRLYNAEDLSTSGYSTADYAIALSNGWHHFCGTCDESQIKLYIDGVLVKTKSATNYGICFHNTASMFIGAESGGASSHTDLFAGKISDVRIYYTTLTADQIAELYNTSASISNNGALLAYEFIEN